MHESMKFDIALSFLRLFPHKRFTFRYDSSFYGVHPDILIRIESSHPKELTHFVLVEIERKKTIDRVFNEKLIRYEQMFSAIAKKKSHIIYCDIWWDVFLRPQEYGDPVIARHIDCINGLLNNLVRHYCKNLPEQRYRFLGFHNFYKLHEPLWLTPHGNRVMALGP